MIVLQDAATGEQLSVDRVDNVTTQSRLRGRSPPGPQSSVVLEAMYGWHWEPIDSLVLGRGSAHRPGCADGYGTPRPYPGCGQLESRVVGGREVILNQARKDYTDKCRRQTVDLH